MFGQVRFATGEQGIYSMKRIKILEGNVCTVKHNGCSYEATLLNKFRKYYFDRSFCMVAQNMK